VASQRESVAHLDLASTLKSAKNRWRPPSKPQERQPRSQLTRNPTVVAAEAQMIRNLMRSHSTAETSGTQEDHTSSLAILLLKIEQASATHFGRCRPGWCRGTGRGQQRFRDAAHSFGNTNTFSSAWQSGNRPARRELLWVRY
jgi:hypothetical protein